MNNNTPRTLIPLRPNLGVLHKSILLLAIPDEYLLKFHNIADVKSLWEAIKLRFGGNVESKKMQKNVLKYQFENFSTASNESLDKAYDRFQKLISQLEVHGAPITKEDINQKFLRSLPSSWNQIALIMRNKRLFHVAYYTAWERGYSTDRKIPLIETAFKVRGFWESLLEARHKGDINMISGILAIRTLKSTYLAMTITLRLHFQTSETHSSSLDSFLMPLKVKTYDRPEPIVTEDVASSYQNDHVEHFNHTSDENIIESLIKTKDIQFTEPPSSTTEYASASNKVLTIQTETLTSTSSFTTSGPQDRWSRDKHIELVNIMGNPGARMLRRAMAKELSVASTHEFARIEAIKIFLAFATYMNFIVNQMDVKSAFLNGKLKEEVYVQQPSSFESSEFLNHVYKLDKALYRLKQAPIACTKGEVGLTSFGNAIGANYLPYLKDYVDLPNQSVVKQFFTEIGYNDQIEATGTLRKSYAMILYCMANGVKIDFAKVIWYDLLSKLQKKHKEKVIPYSTFISLLLEHKMKETYENPEATSIHTPIFSVNNWTLKKDQPEGPPFTAHTLDICTANGPEEFKAPKTTPKTEELDPKGKKPGAKNGCRKTIHSDLYSPGHNASTYLTVEADLRTSDPKNFLPQKQATNLDFLEDDQPLQMSNEDEAEIQAETKDTSVPHPPLSPKLIKIQELTNQVQPSFSNIQQLTKLLINALKLKLTKLFINHDLSASILTELKELPSKVNEINGAVGDLKQYIEKFDIEVPGDLKAHPDKLEEFQTSFPALTTKFASLESFKLDFLVGLLDESGGFHSNLHRVVAALDRFAKAIDSASQKAVDQSVPSAGQVGTPC
ncbi:retrovirus-related pol polyprotein from transposon TNT 1-94 [Tanacetum coccineum]|uniref:Retrovirus-related pol polyprotein from transposon TNT 1-94 n=1 Tax=Tanacetum coccineum TaxID=301880 RepID=A0ABQ5AUY6_9ASTR